MDNIEWKNLGFIGYSNYSVSSDGQVRNDRRGSLLKLYYHKSKNRYRCRIYNEIGSKGFSVHRLVAMAFIPNPDNLPEVNHKDEDPTNNCVDNLEWCTSEYNLDYSSLRKSVDCYTKEGEYIKTFWSITKAAKECNTNNIYITACCRGEKNYAGEYRWTYSGCELHDIMDYEPYSEKRMNYYKEHKEEIKSRVSSYRKEHYEDKIKVYRQKNKEKIKEYRKEYSKKWREENKEEIKKKKREYYQLHKDVWHSKYVEYYSKHGDEIKAKKRELYNRKKNEVN